MLLQVRNSPQQETFNNLTTKYTLSFRDKQLPLITSDYHASVKRKSDSVLIEVLKDHISRQIYFLEQSLLFARENLSREPRPVDSIGSKFKKVIPVDYKYRDVALDMNIFRQLLNKNILKGIEQFVNCIIEFEDCCILVTGFDVFALNQCFTDDCAYGIRLSDVSFFAAAKVKHKENTDKSFTEVLIFVGLYELLVASGYIIQNGSIGPFLGSSFGKLHLVSTTAKRIYVPEADVPIMKTARLLNQYFKCSDKPWGYRCLASFSKRFYPIVPLEFLNHPSQKHKHTNVHHIASHILEIITSGNVIREENMTSFWSLVELLPMYENTTKNISPKPITFDQLMGFNKRRKWSIFPFAFDHNC